MQKEMIKRFLIILKSFPERIVISQKNSHGEVDYAFTNDALTEEALIRGSSDFTNECFFRDEEIDQISEEIVDKSVPLDVFLEEERIKALNSNNLINESKAISFAPFYSKPGDTQLPVNRLEFKREDRKENYDKYIKKHYSVKTREIKWHREANIEENVEKIVSFLHIFIDNTVNEKLKHEKTLREYQRLMLSSVAHEFRNPLNAIKGNLLLIEMNQDPRIEKFVRVSKNSCLLLNSYVEDILDLGRIEGSAFQLNNEEFRIGEIINEVSEIFELEMKHRRIKFQVNIAPRFNLVNVLSDKDRLRQVIINLVSNAIKFCNSSIIVDVFQLFGGSDSEYRGIKILKQIN